MKKRQTNLYVAILIIAAIIFSFLTIYAFGEHSDNCISTSAHSAVLYQPELNVFLYEKNSQERLPMASTTKIMTALVAIEACKMDELVAIDDRAIGIEGSSAYLRIGDVLTVEELLYALLLQSANDAAAAIAYHVSGEVDDFSALMNEKAKMLGLTDTNFTNPHGLDDDEHYTTARDLAIIAAEALSNEDIRSIVSTKKRCFITEDRTRIYINHNKLLSMYDGCIGIKTGFTKRSGRCLVAAAERDGLRFISVTLNAPGDWSDHKEMLDYGYERLEKLTLCREFDHQYKIPVLDGETDYLTVANIDEAFIITERKTQGIEEHVRLVRYAIAPISRGDVLGEIIYTCGREERARVRLLATETVEKKKKQGLWEKFLLIFDK